MSEFRRYDYIIAGAGCAGLSLLVHMIQSQKFRDKKILLIDKTRKEKNDRTWCFWEEQPGIFEPVVYKSWTKAWFRSNELNKLMELGPYQYKLVRGIDFYNWCFELIGRQDNIELRFESVETAGHDEEGAYIIANGQRINAGYVFNSILFQQPVMNKKEYYLLQHFKGWVIETTKTVFDPAEATLMDFRVDQGYGTTFVYVMPFSPSRALIEYTLFTDQLLETDEYDTELKKYISGLLGITDYTITEKEFGIIPMTNHRFPGRQGNVIHIGTAGGQTKASSGYTFQFIQKHSAAIVEELGNTGQVLVSGAFSKKRFNFYDSVLLNVLHKRKLPGAQIFTAMFKKTPPQKVFRFLDNESSFTDELKIISSLPTWPFLKAALQQV